MTDFQWYASADGEHYNIGPCATREAAIRMAISEGCGVDWRGTADFEQRFDLIEATQAPIELADFLDGDQVIEQMVECADDNHTQDDSLFDQAQWSDEQHEELSAALDTAVKEIVRSWQARHGIEIIPWAFAQTRNPEVYTIPRLTHGGADCLYWAA